MNILIINLHSARNLGDDAIMQVTLRSIKEVITDPHITLAANDPESWQKYHEIAIVPSLCTWMGDCKLGRFRSRFFLAPVYVFLLALAVLIYRIFEQTLYFGTSPQKQLLKAYYEADIVLSCGGGNLYAYQSFSAAMVLNLLAIAFATKLGKKTIMLPQSVGPIQGNIQQILTRSVLSQVTTIMVREPQSLRFIKEIIGIQERIILLPDLAFGLTKLPLAAPDRDSQRYHSPQIGIVVIDRGAQRDGFKYQQEYERQIESTMSRLHKELGASIHIITQCHGPSPDQDDRIVARRIFQRMQNDIPDILLQENFNDCFEIRDAFKSLDCIIGTRLHTAIFALSCTVPFILIGYLPKALGTMEYLGLQDYYYAIERLEDGHLFRAVQAALKNKKDISDHLTDIYAQAHNHAREWVRHLDL